jgi:molecular chaperone GrpE (heat shock protein)
MLKLLTRKDLWVSVVFSAAVWFGLPLVGASARFSQAFAGLFLVLSILTLAMSVGEDSSDEAAVCHDPEPEEEEESLYSVLAAQNEAQKKIQAELAAIREDLKSVKSMSGPAARENVTNEAPEKLGELSGALSEAMKQISNRDSQIDVLAKNVNRANIQRNLVRLTQSLEVARSLKARVVAGTSDAKESFEFVVDDMDSALADQGVESMEIAVGTKVADLPAGSFAAISVVDAPEDSLRGTVKEARSRSYFIPEEGKKPRFIAPAKVILYRA